MDLSVGVNNVSDNIVVQSPEIHESNRDSSSSGGRGTDQKVSNRKDKKRPPALVNSPPVITVKTISCCQVCDSTSAKVAYKCPKCLAKYCSVNCCKIHKTVCPNTVTNESNELMIDKSYGDIEGESGALKQVDVELIQESQKHFLESSVWLKGMLKSKRLRNHIVSIDSANDRLRALKTARTAYPQLNDFLEELVNELSRVENVVK